MRTPRATPEGKGAVDDGTDAGRFKRCDIILLIAPTADDQSLQVSLLAHELHRRHLTLELVLVEYTTWFAQILCQRYSSGSIHYTTS